MKPGALLLTPGAGSSRAHPSLVAIEDAVAPMPVRRHDFPYRKAGRKAPDREPVLLADIEEAASSFAREVKMRPGRIVLGGRSMGGRICSMAVAQGLPVAGLVLICYPLHPPGRLDRMRTADLPDIDVPCLFVSGTRDAFGTPEELTAATALVAGPVEHVWIEGGTHELRKAESAIADAVKSWLRGLR